MRKKLNLVKAAGFSALIAFNGAYAASTDERIDNVEGSVELMEESINELRNDLENRMRVSGYVDVEYIVAKEKDAQFRMHHMSLFFQKKIDNRWSFFSEIEYEDAPLIEGSGGAVDDLDGKIFVEAVNLDYRLMPQAIFRFGRFFTPAGIWSIDHYPPFVTTQERPGHIRKIFPQLTDGAMVFGTFVLGKHYLNYNAYVANGEGNNGKGDKNQAKAFGLKGSAIVSVPMLSHAEIGGTIYSDPEDSKNSNMEKMSLGTHAKLKYKDFVFQSEAAFAKFSGTGSKGTVAGYYGQLFWEPSAWGVGARYDMYDKDRSADGEVITNSVFVNYRFNVNLVAKVEHHMISETGKDDTSKTIFSVVSYLE